jgi:ribose-phosphate pyrophosphokinase
MPVNITVFPDNTSQVWKLSEDVLKNLNSTQSVEITWIFAHEGEFLQLAQLKDLLNTYFSNKTILIIKYLPYGRQDKAIGNNSTFALHSFAKLLNCLNFDEVIINDPHSPEALKLISGARAVYPTEIVKKVIELTNSNLICYPDGGALNKYSDLYSFPHIFGEKVRDQLTGNISNHKLVGDPTGKNILIIDDICDGGGTFTQLAQNLIKAGALEVNLFVSHGLFSKGLNPLIEAGIKHIFTQEGELNRNNNENSFTLRRF